MCSAEVTRVSATDLSVELFLREYVVANRPVVVTGAMDSWHINDLWTPDALEQRFGDRAVQVYNNYFDLQNIMPLRQYISRYFGRSIMDEVVPYVRWYSQFRDVEFCWSDEVFKTMSSSWSLPSFLPVTDLLLPYTPAGTMASPVSDPFPAKGLFISARGARTSLHADPWKSCSVLCQLYGRKQWYFYSPDQADYLRNELGVVDVTRPDRDKFPGFARAELTLSCKVEAGEVIYVPQGWYHQVESETDCLSLTWNFVHVANLAPMLDWLEGESLSKTDQSVLRFFYHLPRTCDASREASVTLRRRWMGANT